MEDITDRGTTDFAVEVFSKIQAEGEYTFFVREDTKLPMMMMEDAIRATLLLMEAPGHSLSRWRSGYNVRGMTFLRRGVGGRDKEKNSQCGNEIRSR